MLHTDSFNIARFGQVLQRDIMEHWKAHLRIAVGFFLGYFIILFIRVLPALLSGTTSAPHYNRSFGILILLVSFLYFLYGASITFSHLKTKQRRIDYFMLPAANAEKFLSRVLLYTVLLNIVQIIAFLLADAVMALILWTMRQPADFALPFVLDHLFPLLSYSQYGSMATAEALTPSPILTTLLPYITVVSSWSTYLLGAALFRKQPFLITSICTFAVSIGVAMLAAYGIFSFFDEYYILSTPTAEELLLSVNVTMALSEILGVLWSIFCVWLSYRIFCRAKAIINKPIGF